jgi:hypothetical protein
VLRDRVLIRHPHQRPRVGDYRVVHDAVFLGTSTRSSHDGNPFDTSFCQNPFLPMPDGYRSIVTGPAAQMRDDDWRERFVVRGKLPLGDAVIGEEDLVGMCDDDCVGRACLHGCSRVTSRAFLSKRTPISRG